MSQNDTPKAAEASAPADLVSAAGVPAVVPNTQAPLPPRPIKAIRASTEEAVLVMPCGVVQDDRVFKRVKIIGASVADRRFFGDKKMLSNPGKLTTKFLQTKIVAIDGMTQITDSVLRSMLTFDRDFLMFNVRKLSTRSRPFHEIFVCQHCNAQNEVDIPVDEIEATYRAMPEDVLLRRHKGMAYYDVELPDYGFKGRFMYPDGCVEELLSGKIDPNNMNPYDLDLLTLQTVCLDFNGEGPLKDVDRLDQDFVDDLQIELRKHFYGYNFSPPQKCYSCKKDTPVRVETLDFLLEGFRRRAKEGAKPATSKE